METVREMEVRRKVCSLKFHNKQISVYYNSKMTTFWEVTKSLSFAPNETANWTQLERSSCFMSLLIYEVLSEVTWEHYW